MVLHVTPIRAVVAWGAALTVLGGVALLAVGVDHPVAYLTREPAVAALDGHCATECTYAGLLTNLGALLWATAAVSCLVAAFVLEAPGERRSSPLLWAGVLLAVLLIDDLFAIHDRLFKPLISGGELLVFGAYGLGWGAYMATFHAHLRGFAWPLLVVAAGLFSISILVDLFYPGHHLLEDGSKFIGIVTMTCFFVDMALIELRARLATP